MTLLDSFFNNPLLFGEEILNTMHIFAGSWLDAAMAAVTSAGSHMFYMLALPVLYWCWDKKKAIYTGAIFLIGISVNDFVKTLFNNPRPDPAKLLPEIAELANRYRPKGPGFPSGHAQGAILLWGSIGLLAHDRAVKILCTAMILLIPYSRLYLGVHFLGDVIGGILIGAACFALIFPAARLAEHHYRSVHTYVLIILLLLVPIAVYLLAPGYQINTTMGAMSGFMIGALLADGRVRFDPRNGPAATAVKIVIGLAVVLVIRIGLKKLLPDVPASGFFRYWLVGAWCSLGAPLIFSKIASLRGNSGSE